ncbi:hypothetical protein [Pantoea ananatis]|uniref:hypothetical protein n=1 Tax=Pantoea ananas TaxID=553 RepID=UPI0005A52ABA|nr:hypothetical protein [Pantoea ananatis]
MSEMLVVPPETILNAKRFIYENPDKIEAKLLVVENFECPDKDSFRHFRSVLAETRLVKPCFKDGFIKLVEQKDPNFCDNLHLLRGAQRNFLNVHFTK